MAAGAGNAVLEAERVERLRIIPAKTVADYMLETWVRTAHAPVARIPVNFSDGKRRNAARRDRESLASKGLVFIAARTQGNLRGRGKGVGVGGRTVPFHDCYIGRTGLSSTSVVA